MATDMNEGGSGPSPAPASGPIHAPEHRSLVRRWFDWLLPRKGWVFALSLAWGLAGLLPSSTSSGISSRT